VNEFAFFKTSVYEYLCDNNYYLRSFNQESEILNEDYWREQIFTFWSLLPQFILLSTLSPF